MNRFPRHDPLWLATAIEVAVKAGGIQAAYVNRAFQVDKKGPTDLVTEVDLRVEAECRALLADRFPDHEVLGEEMGLSAQPAPARHRWLIDPIDGTTNYAHGLPIFCASVALEVEGRVEVGAVYDPSRHELFSAQRGSGACLNGTPLGVSGATALLDALLVTGFPYTVRSRSADLVGLFGRFLERARAVRRLGSAALDLCYVAAGRFDGFWEQTLQPWDVAAGMLFVEEAQGRVTTFEGSTFTPYSRAIVASNGRLHDEMLAVIQAHLCAT